MCRRTALSVFALASLFSFCVATATFLSASSARAQQTLGGITGTVSDSTGGVLAATTVTLVNDQTTLTRTAQTNDAGAYDFVNLPIGSYTLTYTHPGFQTQKIPSITVQGDRTATVNTTLKIGEVGSTITVEAAPLLNSVDTTNGYILEKNQIESIPLPTGSFTGLAVLSPGVSSELAGSTGVNSGLGNKPIWANGQRDTSNTFQLNG
ncbi:MAG TPA: carboxypeptidase-like regulatory domain-containing protein, partial [Candidatus Acidoferrum sp.]|nr:carboxypeptidase-like regulatory domain-containing protein [Candidatus Acidoferrum sp.]